MPITLKCFSRYAGIIMATYYGGPAATGDSWKRMKLEDRIILAMGSNCHLFT